MGSGRTLLLEAVSDARRIALLADPAVTQPAQLKALENAARGHGVEAAVFTAATPPEIAPVMDKAKA
jgi:hypothetical protein